MFNLKQFNNMWRIFGSSKVEIEYYSVVYLERITMLEAL